MNKCTNLKACVQRYKNYCHRFSRAALAVSQSYLSVSSLSRFTYSAALTFVFSLILSPHPDYVNDCTFYKDPYCIFAFTLIEFFFFNISSKFVILEPFDSANKFILSLLFRFVL